MISFYDLKVGQKVCYCPEHGQRENGIVKSIPDHTNKSVFVVYNCGKEWDRYQDYTAALTNVCDLQNGWDWENARNL